MAPPERTSHCSLLLIYRPRKDERPSGRNGEGRSRLPYGVTLTKALNADGKFDVKIAYLRPIADNVMYTVSGKSGPL